MSDRMHPIPFEALLDWILGEYRTEGSIFGVKKFWHAPEGAGQPFMGRSIESAVGPAAGPHTQLAHNIVAAYLCGARVFELKTVQVIDGEDLRVSKPCILAEDEGYNCEWSTEMTVPQARDEYIKAWVLLHVLARELGLGRADGFAFCMSVGYDLQYADAVPMLRRLLKRAAALGLFFGVKLTNTFAVKADRGELPDGNIYMSGRALLPLSLRVAAMLRRDFGNALLMSYCGGADAKNIALLARTGLFPVTVCTELLKPGGYEKLYAMAAALEVAKHDGLTPDAAPLDALAGTLCAPAKRIPSRHRAMGPPVPDEKTDCRAVCGVCASVCPNRANVIVTVDGRRQMLHLDGPCNECGNCASFCAEKTLPYRNKLTVFTDRTALEDSQNAGSTYLPESGRFLLRWAGICREADPADEGVPPEVGRVMAAVRDSYPWLLYK